LNAILLKTGIFNIAGQNKIAQILIFAFGDPTGRGTQGVQ
jgi:hypothetical protein